MIGAKAGARPPGASPRLGRWATLGLLAGALLALLLWPPAAWLARGVADATGQRLVLADARGTLWQGSAVVVLTGGADSRAASALPGRLQWTLGLDGAALAVRARHACCITDELRLRIVPRPGRLTLEVLAPAGGAGPLGHWPAAWLAGLGTPWNTLQPSGTLHVSSPGFRFEQAQGRWLFAGSAQVELAAFASAVSTLDVLGSYRLTLQGGGTDEPARLLLSTTSGALQLQGSGSLLGTGSTGARLRFLGQASAAAGSEAVLANLLNIIGRRQGPVSIIAIG